MPDLKAILLEQYEPLLAAARGATVFGLPLAGLSEEDRMVVYALAARRLDTRRHRYPTRYHGQICHH